MNNDELNEKLIRAVKIDCPVEVKRLLVEGGNPYAKGKDGACAFDWADINNKINNPNALEIMKALEAVSMSYEKAKERNNPKVIGRVGPGDYTLAR